MSGVNYQTLLDTFSRYNYIPTIASIQLLSTLAVYASGMAITIYNLSLSGNEITTHIYGAVAIVVLGLLLFAAAMRTESLMLKSISLFNALFGIIAAFEGLFYFGGYTDPIYALGMGIGFIGVLLTNIGVLFYSIRS